MTRDKFERKAAQMKNLFDEVRERVCRQNKRLYELGLVILTEGNVSERISGYAVIKPSGVPYEELVPEKVVVVDMLDGRVVEGKLKPSTDTPTHLEIYRRFPWICGIAHTHSLHATVFAQMGKPIPCYGTTHADAFCGLVPVTRLLSVDEISADYERNTGKVIAEALAEALYEGMNAVLVNRHGPFTFGSSAKEAVDNALILEKVATLALLSAPSSTVLPDPLIKKHYFRKHGTGKYYGQ